MILNFEKPKKIRSTQEHNNMFSSDSGVDGTYVPNMSEKDKLSWKAKHITGDHERVEIRKTVNGTQLLIIVYKKENPVKYDYKKPQEYKHRHQNVCMSMNGKLDMTTKDYFEMIQAIKEASDILQINYKI